MKQSIQAILAFLFVFSINLQAQVIPAKTSDTINRTTANGVKTGYWEEKSGDIVNKGFYNQSRREGFWSGFYTNNVLAKIEYYKDGQKEGPNIQIDRRGKITLYECYHAGVLHGQQIQYTQTGDFPISETNYMNGKKYGLYRLYYDNGKLQEESYYIDNNKNGTSKWFNKSGRTIAEYNYKLGMFNGIQKTFYDNDTLQILANYLDNDLSGDYKEFYRNGKIKITGKYVRGQKDGPWTEFDETGKSVKITKFKAEKAPK
jgi:uncharacterized protein